MHPYLISSEIISNILRSKIVILFKPALMDTIFL